MPKIGRNSPCPCGSGKKYKKCCLPADEEVARASQSASPPPGFDPDDRPPYIIAKTLDEEARRPGGDELVRQRLRNRWTPSKIAGLETEKLEDALGDLGVKTDPASFRALAEAAGPRFEAAGIWAERADELDGHSSDFVVLAACELWKRYLPDLPSMEMLDDWMQDGYVSAKRSAQQACDRWLEVWNWIRLRLSPQMRTTAVGEAVFGGTQMLYNWTQDLQMELHNAAIEDSDFAEKGSRYTRELLDQFSDEDEPYLTSSLSELAGFRYLAGCSEEAETICDALIRDYPDLPIGYATFARLFGLGEPGSEHHRRRALALLDEALARPVENAADWDLKALRRDVTIRMRDDSTRAEDGTATSPEEGS